MMKGDDERNRLRFGAEERRIHVQVYVSVWILYHLLHLLLQSRSSASRFEQQKTSGQTNPSELGVFWTDAVRLWWQEQAAALWRFRRKNLKESLIWRQITSKRQVTNSVWGLVSGLRPNCTSLSPEEPPRCDLLLWRICLTHQSFKVFIL